VYPIKIKGKGEYTGEKDIYVEIQPISFKDGLDVYLNTENVRYVYDGKSQAENIKENIKVVIRSTRDVLDSKLYKVIGDNLINAGKEKTINVCSLTDNIVGSYDRTDLKVDIEQKNINNCEISYPKYGTYTEKKIKPAVKILCNEEKLTINQDYTLKYGKNKTVGKGNGSITISGKGNFFGSCTLSFDIVPSMRVTQYTSSFKIEIAGHNPKTKLVCEIRGGKNKKLLKKVTYKNNDLKGKKIRSITYKKGQTLYKKMKNMTEIHYYIMQGKDKSETVVYAFKKKK